jgi:zinc/manganese transport system substrate-binding protein
VMISFEIKFYWARRVYIGLVLTSLILMAPFASVHAETPAEDKGPLNVVASFSILGDWVQVLGAERVNVISLVKTDEDVHIYNATPKDMAALAKADVLVVNGLGLEGWMERLVHSSGFSGSILTASYGVDVIKRSLDGGHSDGHHDEHDGHDERMHEHAHHEDSHHGHGHADHSSLKGVDPHAWTSLKQARVYIENIASMLARERSAHKEEFEARAQDYLLKLDALDKEAMERLSAIPKSERNIVVPHNSFAYMARDYNLSIHSLSGLNTESEASAKNLARVVRSIREKQIKAIFSENVSNTRMIEQIANETDVKVYGRLISGALSKEVAPSYLSMMRYNVDLVTKALSN